MLPAPPGVDHRRDGERGLGPVGRGSRRTRRARARPERLQRRGFTYAIGRSPKRCRPAPSAGRYVDVRRLLLKHLVPVVVSWLGKPRERIGSRPKRCRRVFHVPPP